MVAPYELSHLDALEVAAILIVRDVAPTGEWPVFLFSGGKDTGVMVNLASEGFVDTR